MPPLPRVEGELIHDVWIVLADSLRRSRIQTPAERRHVQPVDLERVHVVVGTDPHRFFPPTPRGEGDLNPRAQSARDEQSSALPGWAIPAGPRRFQYLYKRLLRSACALAPCATRR